MNADVEKAVERAGRHTDFSRPLLAADWSAIRQHLRDQDAEIERLRNISDGNAELYQHEALRTEKADALLRETLRYLDPRHYSEIIKRITAHLGGEHE